MISDSTALSRSLALRGGVATGPELRADLGVTQSKLSRLISRTPEVVRLGQTRGARYAVRDPLPDVGDAARIWRIDEQGRAEESGSLCFLAHGALALESARGGPVEIFDEGLPTFLVDLAPQGYLGRRFPETHADLGLPARVQDWTDRHRLVAICRRGEDAPGDLVVGEESMDRHLARWSTPVVEAEYPALAERASAGQHVGSSAAGEQPKFSAVVERDSEPVHVLVKFTETSDTDPARRWRDLLVAEALAASTIRSAGVANAAESRLVDIDGERFLEVVRFDRVGERGRRSAVSLFAVDAHRYGRLDSWSAAAARLADDRLLRLDDVERVRWLEVFSRMIGNTDRHFGNLSLLCPGGAGRPPYTVAPSYDVLPMMDAPTVRRPSPTEALEPVAPTAKTMEVFDSSREAAVEFWKRVAADARVSEAYRALAAQRASAVGSW